MRPRRTATLLVVALVSLAMIASAADRLAVVAIPLGSEATAVRLGGPGSDWAARVVCGADGCVIFGETLNSFGRTPDLLAVGETSDHRARWARTYGGTHREQLNDAASATDGGFLLVGASQSLFFTLLKSMSPSRPPRPFLVRIDAAGTPQWARTLDDGAVGDLSAVTAWSAGGHILVGDGPKRGGIGVLAMRIDGEGRAAWTRRYDFEESATASAVLQRGPDIVVAGYTFVGETVTAALVLMLDAEGNVRWARRYSSRPALAILRMAGHADGSLVLVGPANGASEDAHPAAMKLQADGQWVWTRLYRGAEPGAALNVAAAASGDSAIVGRRGDVNRNAQHGLGLLVDADGRLVSGWAMRGERNVELTGVASLGDGRFRVAGDTEAFGAAAVDVVSATWTPARSPEPLASTTLSTETKTVTPTVVPLSPKVIEISASQLVSAAIAVPSR
jgi:hypothetical protein